MAAPLNSGSDCWAGPVVYKHHEKQKVCVSRPKYREGRRARAVKVYTINSESRYVMVQGVPAIGVMAELIQLCALYGVVEEYRPLDEYPAEEFTEVYLVKFQKLTSARAAKRRMDDKSFYGGVLHVCYAPEYETVEDTRFKLLDRRRYVMRVGHNEAREKEQKDKGYEEPSTSNTATTSERIISSCSQMPKGDNTEDNSHSSHCTNFPLLPLPPRERLYHGHYHHHGTVPTEDKMGTLHNAIIDRKEQPVQSSSPSETSSDREKRTKHRLTPCQASAVRFVPRTTHLENKKRKIEEAADHTKIDSSGKNGPLIGPKLSEPPKLDMEDKSLNTTVSLIRNKMKQVDSVPDVKPVEKKLKPRRRI